MPNQEIEMSTNPKEDEIPEHLEEVSTKERIELVKDSRIRENGQIAIALVLVAFVLGWSGFYLVYLADPVTQATAFTSMFTLLIAGAGAAFAIFGLGRTVGRRGEPS